SLNFFCEHHGKNCRDSHFSVLSRWIYQESLVKKMKCSADVVKAIIKNQNLSNMQRKKQEKKLITTYCFEFNSKTQQNIERKYRNIKNIRQFYNFCLKKNEVRTTIFSDLSCLISIE